MRFRKGKAPVELRRWLADNPGEISWGALSAEVKSGMRTALSREQGGVCCYCYGPAEPDSRIEHIEARTAQNILAWDNLALACSGAEGLPPSEHHCDKKKGNLPLKVIHPHRAPVLERVRVGSNGRLRVPQGDKGLGDDIEHTLALNARRPQNARKQALATAIRGLPNRWSARRLNDVLDRLRSLREPIPHQAWVEQWIERQIATR